MFGGGSSGIGNYDDFSGKSEEKKILSLESFLTFRNKRNESQLPVK